MRICQGCPACTASQVANDALVLLAAYTSSYGGRMHSTKRDRFAEGRVYVLAC